MKFLISILLFCLQVFPLLAQTKVDDLSLIREQNFSRHEYDKRKVSYLFKNKKNLLLKYNPVSLTFGGLLFLYQKGISPQVSVNCPYEISCSNFSKQCIQHYGLLKGVALTADRLTRCTQFTLIDLKQIQFNNKGKIVDPIEQYTLKHHEH